MKIFDYLKKWKEKKETVDHEKKRINIYMTLIALYVIHKFILLYM